MRAAEGCNDVNRVRRQEFMEIASIGQGSFSKVFRVKNKFDGMEYALKRSFRAVASELEAKRWQQVQSVDRKSCMHAAPCMQSTNASCPLQSYCTEP